MLSHEEWQREMRDLLETMAQNNRKINLHTFIVVVVYLLPFLFVALYLIVKG